MAIGNIAENEIRVGKVLRQNGKTVTPYDVIKSPSLVYWRKAYSDPKRYENMLKLSKDIAKAMPKCDGKKGRPTPLEALSFYNEVLDWGGGVFFTSHVHAGPTNEGFLYLKRHCPEDMSQREWTRLWCDILVKFMNQGLIPNTWKESERHGNCSECQENGAGPWEEISE